MLVGTTRAWLVVEWRRVTPLHATNQVRHWRGKDVARRHVRHWQHFLPPGAFLSSHPWSHHGGCNANAMKPAANASTCSTDSPSTHTMTHYQVLGVSRSASLDEIKKAHRNLARQYHPDKVEGQDESFRRLTSAWECLRQEETRKQYDEELRIKEQQQRSKYQAAMKLSLAEMQVGQGESDDDVVYIYSCRCGEEVHVWQDEVPSENKNTLVECPGCSFSYSVVNDRK